MDSESAYFAYQLPLTQRGFITTTTTTTTTTVDYMLVFVLQKILSLSGFTGAKYNAYAIFIFFLLCSFSPSTVCLRTARKLYPHALSLEFEAPSIGLKYELKHVESFTMDPFWCKYSWNDAKENRGKRQSLWYVWARQSFWCLLTSVTQWKAFRPLNNGARTCAHCSCHLLVSSASRAASGPISWLCLHWDLDHRGSFGGVYRRGGARLAD